MSATHQNQLLLDFYGNLDDETFLGNTYEREDGDLNPPINHSTSDSSDEKDYNGAIFDENILDAKLNNLLIPYHRMFTDCLNI